VGYIFNVICYVCIIFYKNCLGSILCDFFTISSGNPGELFDYTKEGRYVEG
jgi:hypothetical protein